MIPIREQEDALFEEWERARGQPFYRDGAVNEEAFSNSKPKLLYVLKEPNDPGGEGWDMREFVRDGARAQTWNNITRWTECIRALPHDVPWAQLEQITVKQRKDALQSIAFMNLNKHPGGASADPENLSQVTDRDQEFIRRQIEIYEADYVICCGTKRWLTSIAPYSEQTGQWRQTTRGIGWLPTPNSGWLIDYWHPQAFTIPNELLCYPLADAIGELRQG